MAKRNQDQRLSRAQKEANDFRWYKDKVKELRKKDSRLTIKEDGISELRRMQVGYDLFNGRIDEEDFKHIIKPFGDEMGDMPANLTHKDILSNKIKAVIGMEMSRPFDWKVLAVNSEATTRKEQHEFGMIKEFVINSIMQPIREQLELQSSGGEDITPEERQQIQEQIAQELESKTPEEVKKYMLREHQDPAEVMSHQLMEYLQVRRDAKRKFNMGIKHAAISAREFYWVGEVNGEPDFRVLNPLRANYDCSGDIEFVEDGEFFTYEYRMTPSEVVSFFSGELSNKEIDDIYEQFGNYSGGEEEYSFDFGKAKDVVDEDESTISVFHATWKSLREVNFLTYMDENQEIQEMLVDETYKLNEQAGDISLHSEWIPEAYEAYQIGKDIFKKMRPVPGQFRDMDNIYECPLPYYGAVYDATNSSPTSLVDRGKAFQYLLNIAWFRLEILLASDKGKKVMMNINAIPNDSGIDIKQFQYFFESTPFGWFDTAGEGVQYSDVNTMVKVIDLSTASDISKYIELIEKLKVDCGEAMGVSRQMEAQINQNEAVGNTKQAIVQNSYILEPFYNLHNIIKRNVLTALLETAKVCYSGTDKKKLSYMLDDMSLRTLDLDPALLDNSTLGIFISDSTKAAEIKTLITELAHAALQNQQIRLSDILSVVKEDSITVAEETLKKSEQEEKDYQASMQREQMEAQQKAQQAEQEMQRAEWEHDKEIIVLKEEERRKTELAKAALTGASFNPDLDKDKDGINDFVQLSEYHLKRDGEIAKQSLEERKLAQKTKQDEEKNKIEREKLKQKPNKTN